MAGCMCGSRLSSVSSGVPLAHVSTRKIHQLNSSPPTSSIELANSRDRVLMLGIGGVGKSTLFRQLQADWTQSSLLLYRPVVHGVVVNTIKTLLEQSERIAVMRPSLRTSLARSSTIAHRFVRDLEYDSVLTREAAQYISLLWSDSGIRRTYELRTRFCLRVPHSTPYFMDRVEEFASRSYVPSISDVLNLEVRSTGLVDAQVDIGGRSFEFIDVGGQRNQRAKWLRCWHGVRAIVFVVAVSDFDEVLQEDGKTSRLRESLTVFTELVNSTKCQDLPVVLILNKVDILAQKMRRLRLCDFFPRFNGGADVDKALAFFRQLFMAKVEKGGAAVTVRVAQATDRTRASRALSTILDVVASAPETTTHTLSAGRTEMAGANGRKVSSRSGSTRVGQRKRSPN